MPSRDRTSGHDPSRLAAVLTVVLAGLLLGVVPALPATATPPLALSEQVTDQVGAVEGRASEIQAVLDNLEAEHSVRMWVVFVDTFDDVQPQVWADRSFTATGLGTDDYLLAVAVTDREYGYAVDQAFVLGDGSLARVATAAERHLAENPARAVTTAAGAIGAEVTEISQSPASSSEATWGIVPAVLTGFAVLVGVGIAVVIAVVLTRRDDRMAKQGKVSWISSVGLNQPGSRRAGGHASSWWDDTHNTWSGGGSGGTGRSTRGGSGSF